MEANNPENCCCNQYVSQLQTSFCISRLDTESLVGMVISEGQQMSGLETPHSAFQGNLCRLIHLLLLLNREPLTYTLLQKNPNAAIRLLTLGKGRAVGGFLSRF